MMTNYQIVDKIQLIQGPSVCECQIDGQEKTVQDTTSFGLRHQSSYSIDMVSLHRIEHKLQRCGLPQTQDGSFSFWGSFAGSRISH